MINVFSILLIVGMIVTFSVQNEVPVTVSFLIWEFEVSFVSVIVAAVLAGVVMTQLLGRLRANRQANAKRSMEFLSRHHRW